MLRKLINIFSPSNLAPNPILKRLVPDADKVSAGFSLWLRSLRKEKDDPMAVNAELKKYWDGLVDRGMKQDDAGIPLDSPFTGDISAQLNKWKGEPYFHGSTTLTFKLRQNMTPGWEWFEIQPRGLFRPPLDNRRLRCRADLMPSNRNWYSNGFISEKCRAIIEKAGLTGLQFNWIPDVGHYQAPQWFHAMATEALGRGLDNPLVDPARIFFPDHIKDRYSFESWRFGQTNVSKNNVRQNARLGIPLADQLINLSPSLEFSIRGFRQMLRQFLPDTDFAYIWHWEPSLCCNARAREVLLDNGLLSQNDFVPIWIWDEAPEGALVLDTPNASPVPPFPLVSSTWHEFQKQLPIKLNEFKNNPRPPFTTSFESIFERFCKKHGKDDRSASMAPMLDGPKNPAHPDVVKLPLMWERVLQVSDDFWVNTDENEFDKSVSGYEVIPKKQLAEFNKYATTLVEKIYADALGGGQKLNYLHFAGCDGDSLSFDMNTLTNHGDCKVVEWKHDPLSMGREWPSIVRLLDESMELEEVENK